MFVRVKVLLVVFTEKLVAQLVQTQRKPSRLRSFRVTYRHVL